MSITRATRANPHDVTQSSPGPVSTGLRLGALMAPMVFGVSAGSLALPDAATALDLTPSGTSWLLTAYALSQGAGTAHFGRLADIRGVRRVLAIGTVLLLLGTAGCLLAPGLVTLVVARLLLGAGAGAMTASAFALAAGSPAEHRPQVLATVATTLAVFVGSGTVVGGAVTAATSWRCTLALPLLSLAGLAVCRRLLAQRDTQETGRTDLTGAALLVGAFGGVLVLLQSRTFGLRADIGACMAGTAVLAAGALVWWTRRHQDGFVRSDVVGRRTFLRAAAIGFGVFGGLYATLFAVPQMLVDGRGWGVLVTGAVLMPAAVVGAGSARVVARLRSVSGRVKLVAAGGTFAASLILVGLTHGNVAAALVLVAVGLAAFGLTQAVLVAEVSADTPPALRGTATGALQLCHVMGGAVGSSVAGSLVSGLGVPVTLGFLAALPAAAAAVALLGRGEGSA